MEFKCNWCDTKCQTEFSLKVHEGKMHKEMVETQTFPCSYCDHKSKRKSDLKKHIASKHKFLPNTVKKCTSIFCEVGDCKFGCSSYTELAKHYADSTVMINCLF